MNPGELLQPATTAGPWTAENMAADVSKFARRAKSNTDPRPTAELEWRHHGLANVVAYVAIPEANRLYSYKKDDTGDSLFVGNALAASSLEEARTEIAGTDAKGILFGNPNGVYANSPSRTCNP